MSNAVAVRSDLTQDQVDLVKRTICRGASDDELALFIQRFWAKVQPDGDCLRWTGAIKSNGYGTIRAFGSLHHAHRIALLMAGQELGHPLVVDHRCRNRWCVNAKHLEEVTKSVNALRGIPGQKADVCKRGLHSMIPGNLYVSACGRRRACRACVLTRLQAKRGDRS